MVTLSLALTILLNPVLRKVEAPVGL